jgi:hypothetical protein
MKAPSRLSGKLFKAFLSTSAAYPVRAPDSARAAPKAWSRLHRLLTLIVLASVVVALLFQFPVVFIGLICGGEFLLLVGLVVFRHVLLAPRVSGLIAREREQRRYDLLSLTALGEIGTAWILSKPALQQGLRAKRGRVTSQSARFIVDTAAKVLLALLILASIGGLLDLLSTSFREPTGFTYIIVALAHLVAFAYALRFDIEQTPTLSAIIGMLMPTFVRPALEAQIAAAIAFMTLQAGSYGIALYLIVKLVGARLDATYNVTENMLLAPALNPVLDLLMAAVFFAIFFGIREGLVWLLWRWLCRRLRADPEEVELAMRLKL